MIWWLSASVLYLWFVALTIYAPEAPEPDPLEVALILIFWPVLGLGIALVFATLTAHRR